MFVGWSQVDRFSADLRKMLTPSLRAHFIPSLSQENLVRLIEAINGR
jgi:hypothetical protein